MNKVLDLNIWVIIVATLIAIFLVTLYYWLRKRSSSNINFALIYSLILLTFTIFILFGLAVYSYLLTKQIESVDWLLPALICILPQFPLVFVGIIIQLKYGELFEETIHRIANRYIEKDKNQNK